MSKNLSNEARQRKNEYNAEYVKRTGGAAQKKWTEKNKERKKTKLLTLWLPQDGDIIAHLDNVNNFCEYVKNLIREDIAKTAVNGEKIGEQLKR